MTNVYVAGVGTTCFGKLLDRSVKDLTREAVDSALADAGIAKERVQAAFFANATQSPLEGQHMIAGQLALRAAGFERIPVTNVENACASGSTAFHLAYTQVKAGLADVVLAVGAEKMYGLDRARMFSVFNGAWDVGDVEKIQANLEELGRDVQPPAAERRGRAQCFHGALRVAREVSHEDLRQHAAPARGSRREEPRPFGVQSVPRSTATRCRSTKCSPRA